MSKDIRVFTYYKYVPIENAEQFVADHLAFCKSIGLNGRILVADEGINGTVSGDYETTQKYMDYVHSLQVWKTPGSRLTKKVSKPSRSYLLQKEIVHLGLED